MKMAEDNEAVFTNLTLVLANTLSGNTTQSLCLGNTGSSISGDVYGTLPSGISKSGSGYQWTYSTTPGGARTDISGATSATFTPNASTAPFNAAGTYYVYRNAKLTSTNNTGFASFTATNESNAATITVTAIPSATISYSGAPFCKSAAPAQSVTRTGTSGGTYSASPAGLSINSGTGAITPSGSTAGTFTVTYTMSAAGGCSVQTATTSVTITTSPSATISYAGSPYCSTSGTAVVTRTGTAGGTYSSAAGLTINATTGDITLTSSTAGTYIVTYTIAATGGCSIYTTTTGITITGSANISRIPTSNLILNYRFNGNANDESGNDNGALQNSPSSTPDRFGISNKAYNFNGSSQYVSTANSYVNPSDFTISIWFKTNTTSGGKLIGFGSSQTGQSSSYDRHLYMNNAGQVYFGVYPGSVVTVNSALSYNDNNWHLATATLSSVAGMALYIDGAVVGSNSSTKTAQNYTGYWRIGYDNNNGWTSQPSGYYFNGTLDDALIYSRALNSSEIATLYSSPDGAGNNGPVCAGSSLSFSATTLSGATYAWTGPGSFTSSDQNPTLSYTAANAGVYTLTVTSGGCTATAYTNIVSNTTPGQWTGNLGNNWNDANNWCNGILPDISTNVTIPASATYMADVIGNESCNNIIINTGAILNINSTGTLQISGAITNNGTFDASNGTVEMNGNAAQTIAANTFQNNAVNNLVISNTSATGVTLDGALDIYGSLIYSGTGKKLITNDNLTFKSTAANTAWLGDMTGNTITGKATVERYLPSRRAWRFLSVPTNTTQTIQQTGRKELHQVLILFPDMASS